MKKLLLMFMAAVLILTACRSSSKNDTMLVRPSEFSEETKSILNLFDDELMFFDFMVDETVKSFSINIWVFKDGNWSEGSGIRGDMDGLKKQIAIRVGEDYDLYEITENGHNKYNFPKVGTDFSLSTAIASNKISQNTSIVLNKEIPLFVKVGTDKNRLKADIMGDFRNIDCNAGVAISVTFSDKTADNN